MITVTADDANRTVTTKPGEEITVTLSENRTTGFQWVIEAVTGELTLVSSDFEQPTKDQPGAGGRRAIVLRAGGPGVGELRLRYERGWASGSHDVQRQRFSFVIKSA